MIVPPSGYVWWYLDALSDDGKQGLTLIAFIGSVFSPYYAWRRRQGPAEPLNHCAMNVALYTPERKHWAMTERGTQAVERDSRTLTIGPSAMEWHGDKLSLTLAEITLPWLAKIRGSIRLYPTALPQSIWTLSEQGAHHWSPIAPVARVEVDLQEPGLKWSGNAYLDSNDGAAPLEDAFADWHWSRASLGDGTVALYDIRKRDGYRQSLALRYRASGEIEPLEVPRAAPLPSTRWGIRRETHSDDGNAAVTRTLEDTPFYARSLVSTRLMGEQTLAVHESLSLNRFRSPLIQAMLPFRMPRRS